MTERPSDPFTGLTFNQDPLEDPLVVVWDAVVGLDTGIPSGVDPDDVVLLRRFHTLYTVPAPSPDFFADLERQLATLPSEPAAKRTSVRATTIASFQGARPSVLAHQPRATSHALRWTSMRGALAVLSVMLLVSLLVLSQAAPGPTEPPPIPAAVIAKPSIESIAQFEFVPPMWGVPDATDWTHMEIGMFRVAPATSFTTDLPFYTSIDGSLSIAVLNGNLAVTPAGPAFFYPANRFTSPPEEVPAGVTVSVGPNDALVFSAKDTAKGSNSGTESALAVYGLVGTMDKLAPGSHLRPSNVSLIMSEYANPISVPTKGATVTLQRLALAPFDTFVFDSGADILFLSLIDPYQTHGLRIAEGALEGLIPQSGSQGVYGGAQLRYLKPGPHTIINLGDETKEIYFLVVEPAPVAATPSP